jgi:hypothetical protein
MVYGMNLGKKSLVVKPAGPRPGTTSGDGLGFNKNDLTLVHKSIADKQRAKAPVVAAPAPAPVTKPAPMADPIPGLAALQSAQEENVMNEYEKLRRQYALMNAQLNNQQRTAETDQTMGIRAAGRSGSNERQNMLTELASMGMDDQAGLVQIGNQSVAANAKAQDEAARNAFSDAMAKIMAEREQAMSTRELGKLDIQSMINNLRIQNSMTELQRRQNLLGDI